MEIGSTRIKAGSIEFALQHRRLFGGREGFGYTRSDQGVSIQVLGQENGKETEMLRFDCFESLPNYHYGPEKKNEKLYIDQTTEGHPIGWSIRQLRTKLPDMLKRAGYEKVADILDMGMVEKALPAVDSKAREISIKERENVTHFRGDLIIEAGNIRFGLDYRKPDTGDEGQAIHILSDVAGSEIELIAVDCFKGVPHFHYGPRNRNESVYLDKTLVPDTLRWMLDRIKGGKLRGMIQKAGYPDIAAQMDEGLVQDVFPELEKQAMAMEKANK